MTDAASPDFQEIQDLLKRLGLDSKQWGEMPEREVQLPAVDNQKKALIKLQGLLEGVVESDRQTVLQLREQLNRLRYGGGS